ncbi:ABC transporter permease [Hymenobacter volaticus]|uniref:ABC transporter permease n=1 Tax=Hymenobacter volaticus TaxID=2932254 RepID=A0ABY4G3T4_9BACT|nr:ABC transporter permease [Hymenobacter volaticus]UOQ65507.1 ABC transporter permease [Hymenobacter volaticus]
MTSRPYWIKELSWQQRLAAVWLLALCVAAVFAGLLPESMLAPDLQISNAPPLTPGHWLGTDQLGQDVTAALIYGARTTLLISLPAAGLATSLGTSIGLLVGYWGNTRLHFALAYWIAASCAVLGFVLLGTRQAGIQEAWWLLLLSGATVLLGKLLARFSCMRRSIALPLDWLMQAAITLLAAIPRLLLILTVAAAFEVTPLSLVLLLAFTSWTQSGRLVRAEVHRVRQLPYFEAARAAGLPARRIMRYHLLPNTLQPIVTSLPLSIAAFIVLETTLSFLG